MKLTLSYSKLLFWVIAIFAISSLGFLVGGRGDEVGADTAVYRDFYENLYWAKERFYEPGFHYLSALLKVLGLGVNGYFFFIYISFNAAYLFFFYSLLRRGVAHCSGVSLLLLFSFLFFSSWYLVATTNGLRQGLALPFVYASLLFFGRKDFLKSILFFCVALSFHYSVLLIFPFIPLLLLVRDSVFFVMVGGGLISYAFGVPEYVIRLVSELLGIPLYQKIASYGADSGNWVGFDIYLFAYSLFWFLFFYACCFIVPHSKRATMSLIWRIYGVAIMPYAFFGFGGYSNRYAFMGWLLIPAGQACLMQCISIPFYQRLLLAVLLAFSSSLIYIMNLFDL